MLQSTTVMNHSDLLNELAQQEPTRVRAWLETVWAKQPEAAAQFNWLGLFEIAIFSATRAAGAARQQESLAWANVAISIFQLLSDHNQKRAKSVLDKLMAMRVALIIKFGVVPNHEILDANDIVAWFYRELEMPYSDAAQEAARWPQTLDLNVIRKLRNIKTRLFIIERLLSHDRLPVHVAQALHTWISLKPNLP